MGLLNFCCCPDRRHCIVVGGVIPVTKEYQTDMGRCRFDSPVGKLTPAQGLPQSEDCGCAPHGG